MNNRVNTGGLIKDKIHANTTRLTSANRFVLLAALPSLPDTLHLQGLCVPTGWKTNPYLWLTDDGKQAQQKGSSGALDFRRQNQHKPASRLQVSEAAAVLAACLQAVHVCVCVPVPIKYTWPCYLWDTICVPGKQPG